MIDQATFPPVEQDISVLVADDHQAIRDGLGALIRALDDITLAGVAADGFEAVARCRVLRPDVVLMDLEMPNMDGVDATRQIMFEHPGTAVLALTSLSHQARILEAFKAGACGSLLKDVSAAEIADSIRRAARGESPLDPRAAHALLSALANPA